ncbi:MAG: hypothetical protein M3Q30_03210 [Actinomycetota bacterium]|nr:hypothetical protein [Actinomycetota bacterium]
MDRYLVVVNYDGPHDRLVAEVRAFALAGEARFHIVVPAVPNAGSQTEGRARAAAARRLDAVESALAQVPGVDGEVGDADVYTAIRDSLDRAAYDVLVVVTPRVDDRERARIVDRLVRLFGLPVVHVSADESTWLQHHPMGLGLGIDQGATRRGPLTAARRHGRSLRLLALALACCVLFATTIAGFTWGASRGSATQPFPSITATESDFTIQLSASRASAGPISLVVRNRGPSAHELVVFRTTLALGALPIGSDGNVNEDSTKLEKVADSGTNIPPGQSRTLYAILTPGSYVFICNLPGHYRLGMHAALVVQ